MSADVSAMEEDFSSHLQPLPRRHPRRLQAAFWTLDNFKRAASWVASRAFGVDSWHGDAMVPLADIFNHKASVVDLARGYEVEGQQSGSEQASMLRA